MKVVYHCLEDIRHKSTTVESMYDFHLAVPHKLVTAAIRFIPLSQISVLLYHSIPMHRAAELCLRHSDNVIGEN